MIKVVKVYIENDKGQFLLIKRASTDSHAEMWETPGGGIEEDENTLMAAHREVFEESGLDVESLELSEVIKLRDDKTDEWYEVLLVSLKKPMKDPIVNLDHNDDHSDFVWLYYDEIANFILKGNEIDRWTLTQLLIEYSDKE